jgi:hypothetical protein
MKMALAALAVVLVTGGGVPAQEQGGQDAELRVAPTAEDAEALFKARKWSEAAMAYRQVVKASPDDGVAWFRLGYSLHATGDYAGAIPAHEKAAELGGTRVALAMYNAGCAHALQGDTESAVLWLQKARTAMALPPAQWRTMVEDDADLAGLRNDPAWQDVLPPPADRSHPFAEPVTILQSWVGETGGDQFGWEARNVGDVDGDGVNDVLSSSPTALGGKGRVYLYAGGGDGELLHAWTGEAAGEKLGDGINGAGDVNADGVPDVIIGSPGWRNGTGRVRVFSADGEVLHEFVGAAPGDRHGDKVFGPGDWDGDGHDDVLVGADRFDGAGADAGRVYLYSGKDGSALLTLDGEAAGDRFGTAVAGLVQGEHRFLVVGAQDAGANRGGRVYVFKGESSEPFLRIEPEEGSVNLGRYFLSMVGDVDADGVPDAYCVDFEYSGGSGAAYVHSGADGRRLHVFRGRSGEGLGIGDARAGDVDGDGHDDLVVGAWQNGEHAPSAGKVYVYSGKDGSVLRTLTGTVPGDTFGFDATGMGDVDGDGVPDYVITSAWSDDRGPQTGRTYVISGAVPDA